MSRWFRSTNEKHWKNSAVGHIRLGRLPKTKPWLGVFQAVTHFGVDAPTLAAVTANAAASRFDGLKSDETLQQSIWYLAALGNAARAGDFGAQLMGMGIEPQRAASGLGLVSELANAIRGALDRPPSTLGELAIKSAQHVVAERIVAQSRSLFGTTLEDVRTAASAFGTKDGFSLLARDFFGDFAGRMIQFLVDKELPNHVGASEPIRSIEESAALGRDISRYCRESAEIVRDFADGWYSKANWQTDRKIDRRRAKGFLAHALTKLRAEIERGKT